LQWRTAALSLGGQVLSIRRDGDCPICPELNPQEHVWERARDAISHNHTYRRFQSLIDDFETYLNDTLFSTDFMAAFRSLGLGMF
jgi:hypothetical protein